MLFDEQGSYKGFREVKEKQRVKNKKDIKNSRLQASKADSLSANTKPQQKCWGFLLAKRAGEKPRGFDRRLQRSRRNVGATRRRPPKGVRHEVPNNPSI